MINTNNAEVGVGGYFKIEAVNAETGERRVLADWFKNLITDQGLNRLGTGANVCTYVLVGSGSNPPAFSDTQLQSFVAVTQNVNGSDVSGYVAGPPSYVWSRRKWRFNQGAAAGNLTEIGVNWNGSSSAALFSRSLIKNGNGDPTSITVLASEFLDVTYELRLYPPQADVIFQTVISGQVHDCVLRPALLSSNSGGWGNGWNPMNFANAGPFYTTFGSSHVYSGPIGTPTGLPSGDLAGSLNYGNGSYANNSFAMPGTVSAGLNDCNLVGGIKSLVFQNYLGTFQVQFTPNIMKDATKILSLNLQVSWARRP